MRDLYERYCADWSADSVRIYNTPSETARNNYFYVQECGYFKTSPRYYTERKNLDAWLVIYTLSGSGVLRYGGKKYQLPPNALCCIDCRRHHKYQCNADGQWEFLWFHFNGANAGGYYKEFVKDGFSVVQGDMHTKGEIEKIISLTQNKQRDSEIRTTAHITNILAYMISAAYRSGQGATYLPAYISRAVEYIEQHYQDRIVIKSLSEEAGYSNEHFTREFKKYIGVSAREYITAQRLNRAKELLQASELSVEEVAGACGFGSASRFIEVFRKNERITPLVYRHQWRIRGAQNKG